MDKVLVVDDIQDNIVFLTFELEDDGFEVIPASDGASAIELATKERPNVILLDVYMPGIDGLETLKRLKASEETNDIPVIMISADSDDKNVISAIDLGAHDFVSKPIEYAVLAARMRSALRLSQALKELEDANNELHTLATEDSLTHCYNRRHFFSLSEREVAQTQRHQRNTAVLMMDIDLFKRINDTYGHAAGDKALKIVAMCCKNACRDTDIVGRLGGEEFALCCPDANIEGAMIIAERIRTSCEELALQSDGQQFSLTVSLGVTLVRQNETIYSALKRADGLLYQAKQQGRNRCIAQV